MCVCQDIGTLRASLPRWAGTDGGAVWGGAEESGLDRSSRQQAAGWAHGICWSLDAFLMLISAVGSTTQPTPAPLAMFRLWNWAVPTPLHSKGASLAPHASLSREFAANHYKNATSSLATKKNHLPSRPTLQFLTHICHCRHLTDQDPNGSP